jgi:HPt (histidine-containing phosphotransfer) domain-containing protein
VDGQARFEARIRGLRADYVAALPARLLTMRAALEREDRTTLHYEAHRLAGTGMSYGFPQLTEWGRSVEKAIKAGAESAVLAAELDRLSELIVVLAPLELAG